MGIESPIYIGYGFLIPEKEYDNLLKRQPFDTDEYEEGDYLGDGIYTHDFLCFRTFYLYGKIIHDTEAREYFWDGNRQVLDLKKAFKIHHMQKKKIDKMAKKCRTKAKYFTIAAIH